MQMVEEFNSEEMEVDFTSVTPEKVFQSFIDEQKQTVQEEKKTVSRIKITEDTKSVDSDDEDQDDEDGDFKIHYKQ